jgi:hypothetical protein
VVRETTIKIYMFNELREKIQEKILSNWRNNDVYPWAEENKNSLNEFAKIFDCIIMNFSYGDKGNYVRWYADMNSNILELSGYRLNSYLHTNFYEILFLPKKYWYNVGANTGEIYNNIICGSSFNKISKIKRDPFNCPLTGYYIDNSIISPIINFMQHPVKSINFEDLLYDCFDNWASACYNDYEDWLSEKRIKDEILTNNYEFLENGEIYN